MTWDSHVQKKVIPALANRARALKQTMYFMDPKFKRLYANSIFRGKMSYAIDAWAGVGKTLINKVQDIQDRVAKQTIGKLGDKWSKNKRLTELGWLPVEKEAISATVRFAHKILHKNIPKQLSTKMPPNTRNLRLTEAHKFDTKPRMLNLTKKRSSSFRNRAYVLNTLPHRLTAIEDSKTFNKWTRVYLKNPSKLPIIIPKTSVTKPRPNPTASGTCVTIQPNQTSEPVNGIVSTEHRDVEPVKQQEKRDIDPVNEIARRKRRDDEPIKEIDDGSDPLKVTSQQPNTGAAPVKDARSFSPTERKSVHMGMSTTASSTIDHPNLYINESTKSPEK